MKIDLVILKGIKDDILNNQIVINLELNRTPENIRLCEDLSQYKPTKDSSGYMTVTFAPRQITLWENLPTLQKEQTHEK